MGALEARDGLPLFGADGLHIHANASLLGAPDPPSLSEDLVFSRADAATARRFTLKKPTDPPDALG
jgi:hypothetical protein